MRDMFLVVTTIALLVSIAWTSVWAQPVQASLPADLTPTGEPPTPTPGWDKSSVSVTGYCNKGVPTFTVKNNGAAMTGTAHYWLLNQDVGASACAQSIINALGEGDLQLGGGASIDIIFPKGLLPPPYAICAAQRKGHPGVGFAAAAIRKEDICVTAEKEVPEPIGVWHLFVPNVAK